MPTPKRRLQSQPPSGPPAATKREESAAQVLRLFRLTFSAVRKHFHEVEKSVGVGGAQVWALSRIRDNPGVRVTELAAMMDVHQSTASNLVRSLVTRQLIRSEQSTQDGRFVLLYIRPAGRALLRRVPGPFTGVLPKALSELDAATLRRLEADLARLLDHLGADPDAAQRPLAQI